MKFLTSIVVLFVAFAAVLLPARLSKLYSVVDKSTITVSLSVQEELITKFKIYDMPISVLIQLKEKMG